MPSDPTSFQVQYFVAATWPDASMHKQQTANPPTDSEQTVKQSNWPKLDPRAYGRARLLVL